MSSITVQPSWSHGEPRVFVASRLVWALRHNCLVISAEERETWIPMAQIAWFEVSRDPDIEPQPRRSRRRRVALAEAR